MSERRCVLCNKEYDYEEYDLFGRGCLNNLYSMLDISTPPRGTKNREMYLCNRIAWKNYKFFLNKNKKYMLTQKYIALNMLDKINFNQYPYNSEKQEKDIDQNSLIDDIKEKISKDIKNISVFSKNAVEIISFKLNDVYELFNDVQRFEEIIKTIQNMTLEELDEKIASGFLNSLIFIFDLVHVTNPIMYAGYFSMQYVFWEIVVIGGLLKDMQLSAKLLSHSLSMFGSDVKNLIIQDETTDRLLISSIAFNSKISELVEKYGTTSGKFDLKDYEKSGVTIRFETGDLLYAIHNANMFVKGTKNEDNTWNIEGEIIDTYDFTEFNDLRDYSDNKKNELTDIFSTTLNNLGVVSSKYGVIKPYEVTIKFSFDNYEVK